MQQRGRLLLLARGCAAAESLAEACSTARRLDAPSDVIRPRALYVRVVLPDSPCAGGTTGALVNRYLSISSPSAAIEFDSRVWR